MKARPMFRVWWHDKLMLDTSPDCLINPHGKAMRLRLEGTIMLNTGIRRDSEHYFYELDMGASDSEDDLGIVVIHNGETRVWFGENDWELLDEIDLKYIGHYFAAMHYDTCENLKGFAETFPIEQYFKKG